MSLWANKNDLSISAGAHVSQEASPLAQLVELNHQVLINDSQKVFAQLRKLKHRRDVRIGEAVQCLCGFSAVQCLGRSLRTHRSLVLSSPSAIRRDYIEYWRMGDGVCRGQK